jgi:pimeloyl-ACP methyl ester carboxylesterase
MATLTRPSGRTVEYAQSSTGGASDWPVAVVFPPLFQAAAMVLDDNFVAAAASAGLRVVCVSRPGIGETSPVGGCPDASPMQSRSEASGEAHGCLKRWSTSVEACLATHCADVAAVLAELGASCVRIVGICAGTPYALHFYTQHAALVSNVHLTLVVPWVPADCPEHKRLIRLAAQGWLGPHAAIGTLLGVAPAAAGTLFLRGPLDAPSLTKEFTPSERAEFERQCAADDTRAARFVGNLRRHMRAYSLHGVRGDIASSLATQHDLGLPTAGASYSATAGAGLGSVGASRVRFATDRSNSRLEHPRRCSAHVLSSILLTSTVSSPPTKTSCSRQRRSRGLLAASPAETRPFASPHSTTRHTWARCSCVPRCGCPRPQRMAMCRRTARCAGAAASARGARSRRSWHPLKRLV